MTIQNDPLVSAEGFVGFLRRLYQEDPFRGLLVAIESLPDTPAGLLLGMIDGRSNITPVEDGIHVSDPGPLGDEYEFYNYALSVRDVRRFRKFDQIQQEYWETEEENGQFPDPNDYLDFFLGV